MKPKRRWWRRIAIAFAVLFALLGVLLVAAFQSETAFRAVLDVAKPFIPGELRYTQIGGTLAGPINIVDLDYRIAGTRIEAATLDVDLAPFALLAGRVSIDRLDADTLTVTLPPPDESRPDEPASPRDILAALALPVHITADAIDIETVRIIAGDGETLLALDALKAALDWNDERASITNLDASGPLFGAAGELSLGLKQGHTSELEVQGRWNNATFPVAGSVAGSGDAAALDLTIELREPANATLVAQLRDLLDVPSWQGTLNVAALKPSVFEPSLPAEAWSGEFRFDGDWNDTHVAATVNGGWPPASGVRATLDALVNAERIRVETLNAHVAAFGSDVSLQGELRYGEALAYNAAGNVTTFAWPGLEAVALRDVQFETAGDVKQLRARIEASAGDGRIDLDGQLAFADLQFEADIAGNDLVFDFNGTRLAANALSAEIAGVPSNHTATLATDVRVNDLPVAQTRLRTQGTLDGMTVDIESLQWLNGNAGGTVVLAWRDTLTLGAQLAARGLQLVDLDPRLDGSVGGVVHADADFGGEQPAIDIAIESLTGELAETTITGGGDIRLANGRLTTEGLNIHAGDARLELEDAERGFDFRFDASELGALHPELRGGVRASGHIEGELAAPGVQLALEGTALAWRDWQAGSLRIDAYVQAGAMNASTVRMNAGGLESPWVNATALALEIDGDRTLHRLSLDIDGGGRDAAGNLQFALSGGLRDGEWRGELSTLRFEHPAIGPWQLVNMDSQTPIVASSTRTAMPRYCVRGPSGQACAGPLSIEAGNVHAEGSLDRLPVGMAAGWLPPGLDYAGEISGGFRVTANDSGLDGSAQFDLGAGGIHQQTDEGAETLLGWESGDVHVSFEGREARGELEIRLLEGDRIGGTGTLTVPANGATRIDANLAATIDNLGIIPSLVPELSRLDGNVAADLRISGPLDAPRVRGEARLRNGRASILALGTDWEDIELTLRAEGRDVSMDGRAESGKGHIEIALEGHDTERGFIGEARLSGENFKAVKTTEADVNISPRLNLALEENHLFIDGEVSVPFARITPRNLSTAVQASGDQVVVNAEDGASGDELRVHTAVTTRLGDDVRINAFGLAARLEGALTVAQQPGNPATGNGRLIVAEGEYTAYGQDLTLAKGELIYAGQPLSNPGLDIRAERTPEPEITVGVAVRGPLAQPVTSVYSEPAMPETEALAYLLFGRPIAQATGEEEGQISEAAIALGLGGQKLLGNVGRKLGVEEFRVEEVSDRERASLVLGKYLSSDLYVSYGIGLFDAVNSFRIRYRISSKWMLEATSGLKSSADFIYTIER